jgi:hypothetical protein
MGSHAVLEFTFPSRDFDRACERIDLVLDRPNLADAFKSRLISMARNTSDLAGFEATFRCRWQTGEDTLRP